MMKTPTLTPEMLEYFMRLACALSPENLHCDGEISMAEANREYIRLMREWRAGERLVGHPVHEDDVWVQNRLTEAR
jgi:DUF1680 family protein